MGLQQPVETVSCGMDLHTFRPRGDGSRIPGLLGLPDRPTILFVGRLDEEKHIHELIDALPGVRGHVDAQLAIVGIGGRRASLRARATTLGVAAHVHLLGFVPDTHIADAYAGADVFAMPGIAELQSLATLEAMACGKPVVAADAMALPHLVRHGHNGYLYTPGDVAALTAALTRLLTDPRARHRMGATSRHIAEQHHAADSLARLESIYTDLIAAHAIAPASQITHTR
jgi:glycosyltransferase involved in cell wall biosynthesis